MNHQYFEEYIEKWDIDNFDNTNSNSNSDSDSEDEEFGQRPTNYVNEHMLNTKNE